MANCNKGIVWYSELQIQLYPNLRYHPLLREGNSKTTDFFVPERGQICTTPFGFWNPSFDKIKMFTTDP